MFITTKIYNWYWFRGFQFFNEQWKNIASHLSLIKQWTPAVRYGWFFELLSQRCMTRILKDEIHFLLPFANRFESKRLITNRDFDLFAAFWVRTILCRSRGFNGRVQRFGDYDRMTWWADSQTVNLRLNFTVNNNQFWKIFWIGGPLLPFVV